MNFALSCRSALAIATVSYKDGAYTDDIHHVMWPLLLFHIHCNSS